MRLFHLFLSCVVMVGTCACGGASEGSDDSIPLGADVGLSETWLDALDASAQAEAVTGAIADSADDADKEETEPDVCQPDCSEKECGKDGCGGSCGECAMDEICSPEGVCECLEGLTPCDGICCAPDEICYEGTCCQPVCTEKECGPNGCGGICGECAADETCSAEGVCECLEGLAPCDGSCCAPDEACHEGACCQPDCTNKECGSDGCGGVCGECVVPEYCASGSCVEPPEGEFGYPCTSNEDCLSGMCVEGPSGFVCTTTCTEDCPDGWLCKQAGQFPDVVFICLYDIDYLCEKECETAEDCGLPGNLCLEIGVAGTKYCSRQCYEQPCPPQYECLEMADDAGYPTMQCVPIAGACECVGMDPGNFQDDPENCGSCQHVCSYDNAEAYCVNGICEMGPCLPGFQDANGDDEDGCEYGCVGQPGSVDHPDPDGFDENCDGIDGMVDKAVFVAVTGADLGNQVGSMEFPVKTITKGILLAASHDPPFEVYIAAGNYQEEIVLVDGVSLYGGFDPSSWEHDPSMFVTSIQWSIPGEKGVVALLADGITSETVVAGLTIQSASNGEPGGNSFAVAVENSSDGLRFFNCVVVSGNGGDGLYGQDGQNGEDGSDGGDGQAGCEYDGCEGCFGCSNCTLPPAGSGAAGGCNGGGDGGQGGPFGGTGEAGEQAANDGAQGGAGGDQTEDGFNGQNGEHGDPGIPGEGGDGYGTLFDGIWIPSAGGDGTTGDAGGGGAGGGGGGGDGDDSFLSWECYTYGASGGGGGGGGCPGTGGTGGTGGGASAGFFIVNSQPVIENCIITYRFGGNGGNGGDAGSGGFGGDGGDGGPGKQDEDEGAGGDGGNGGHGGTGGAGGGGSGGVSFGIFWLGGIGPTCNANTFDNQGSPGVGAIGGAPDFNNGQSGMSGDVSTGTPSCPAE